MITKLSVLGDVLIQRWTALVTALTLEYSYLTLPYFQRYGGDV